MTRLSKKCQYALRSVLELSSRYGQAPVSVSEIAAAQAIPRRFLELIIKELKHAGLVDAYRGVRGGYTLTAPPDEISVGAVIQLIDGSQTPVGCEPCGGNEYCPLTEKCVWTGLWRQVHSTVQDIYDATTFEQLMEGQFVVTPASPPQD